jgi:hypothetical protein
MKHLAILLTMLFAWLQPSLTQAQSISWSSLVGDDLFNSQGVALDASFRFEVGIFTNGFVPTGSNMNDWNTNWLVFDAAIAGDGWNVGAQYFASNSSRLASGESDSIYASAGVFPANAQAFLWVYNSKGVLDSSEWALVSDFSGSGNISDRWIFPAIPNPDLPAPVLTWSLSDAETAIFGAVQSGNSIGEGIASSQPSSFSLQTYQVPEPGSALLVGAAGMLILIRRRRFWR